MSLHTLSESMHVALAFSVFYFSAALITGVWKWRAMLGAADGEAHRYLDVAHHAALHYGPFIVLAGGLASFWPWSDQMPSWVLVAIMGGTMVLSLSRYISLGFRADETNQLRDATASAKQGLVFFFIGSVLPGLTIAVGAAIELWGGLSDRLF